MKKYFWFFPLLIVIASVLWGLDGVVIRPALYSLPVTTVVFLEHALGFLIMIPFLIYEWKKLKDISKSSYGYFLLVALFGGALGTLAITKGLFYVNFASLSAVILLQKLQPIFAIFLAWLILKEKLPKKFYWYAGLALVGAYAIAFPGLVPNFATGDKTTIAAFMGLLAAVCWGASTVFSKRALQETNFRIGTYLRYGFTTLIMLVLMLGTGSQTAIPTLTNVQWQLLLLIVFSSGGLAMLLYYFGLKHTKASVSTICELGLPLSAIVFDYFIHGSVMSATQFLGAGILLFSIIMVSRLKEAVAVA
ncbi:MAG: DMT family transporter [Candidatus Magasanikiibacteriota bacterium]